MKNILNSSAELLKVRRRLGYLEEHVDKNIRICKTLNLKDNTFYDTIVHYIVLDFLFGPEFIRLSSDEAFEIREFVVSYINKNYKDKIMNSFKT